MARVLTVVQDIDKVLCTPYIPRLTLPSRDACRIVSDPDFVRVKMYGLMESHRYGNRQDVFFQPLWW